MLSLFYCTLSTLICYNFVHCLVVLVLVHYFHVLFRFLICFFWPLISLIHFLRLLSIFSSFFRYQWYQLLHFIIIFFLSSIILSNCLMFFLWCLIFYCLFHYMRLLLFSSLFHCCIADVIISHAEICSLSHYFIVRFIIFVCYYFVHCLVLIASFTRSGSLFFCFLIFQTSLTLSFRHQDSFFDNRAMLM